MADWVLADATQSAREDFEWEKDLDTGAIRAGEIRFTSNNGCLNAQGAGIRNQSVIVPDDDEDSDANINPFPPITSKEEIPAIASKTAKARDIYNAQQGQGEFGFEMKALTKPLLLDDGLVSP